jgi:hypothetical protein
MEKGTFNLVYRSTTLCEALHDVANPFIAATLAVLHRCPYLLEENCICACFGRIGFFSADNQWARGACLTYGMVMNIAGFLVTCFAALALSEHPALLELASWGRADLTVMTGPTFDTITMDLGLRAVFIHNPNTFGEKVVRFDQFCDLVGNGIEKYMDPDDCDQCNQVSMQLFIAIVVAVVAFLPTITVDILRMYSNYDVNCQKVWAALFSMCTLAGCVLSYYQFTYVCLESFYDGEVLFRKNGELADAQNPSAVSFDFDWDLGIGIICLFCGFGCKFLNFFCSCCCVPTPSITRNREEQEEYEKLDMESDGDDSSGDEFSDDD